MKKILALLMALVMALSLSAASLGEAAEVAAEKPVYTNFQEHVQAFLGSINIQENDLFVAVNAGEQTLQALLGVDETGTINLMAGMDGETLGILQADTEAAYLSYQGSVMALSYETVRSFVANLPQKLLGYLAQLGIDPQQLMADAQTLVSALQTAAMKLMPCLEQSVDGSVMTITVNGETFGELLGQAIDDLLADASIADIINRYATLTGAQITGEQLAQAWTAYRAPVVAIAKTLQGKLVVDQESGDFSMDCSLDPAEGVKITMNIVGKATDKAMNMDCVLVATNGEEEYRVELSQTQEKNSFWLDYPTKVTQHEVVYQNGQEIMTSDMSLELSDSGMPVSFLMTMSQMGQEMARVQYADNTFCVYMQGAEVLYVQVLENFVTVRIQGTEIVAKVTENDGDHMTVEETITSNGTTMVMHMIYAILENEGTEYLQITADQNGEVAMTMQLFETEKQPFALLKDDASLNWVTEDMLNGLLDQAVAQLIQNISGYLQ